MLVIDREEQKLKNNIKTYAKKGSKEACRTIACQLVRSRKTAARLKSSIITLQSLDRNLKLQSATSNVTSNLKEATGVIKALNNSCSTQEFNSALVALSQELVKSSVTEDLINETLDSVLGLDGDDEKLVDTEVESVLSEILSDVNPTDKKPISKVSPASESELTAGSSSNKDGQIAIADGASSPSINFDDAEFDEMEKRLQNLRSFQ